MARAIDYTSRDSVFFRSALETAVTIATNAVGGSFTNAQHFLPDDVCDAAMRASAALQELGLRLRKLNLLGARDASPTDLPEEER